MESINDIVLKCYQEVINESGLELQANTDNKIGKEFGLDSLGFVNLIINIEEKLNMEFDSILIQLRKCKKLEEIIFLIEDVLKQNKGC